MPDQGHASDMAVRSMSTDAHEELFRLLLQTAEEAPLGILGDCVELMTTVLARRLHDETGEMDLRES